MSRALVQLAYADAEARMAAVRATIRPDALALDARLEAGELGEDAWASAHTDLEDAAGWPAAFAELMACRHALLTWGAAQVRRRLGGGVAEAMGITSLAEVEALFARPGVQHRLAPIIMRLNPTRVEAGW